MPKAKKGNLIRAKTLGPDYVFERLVTKAEAGKGQITIRKIHHAAFEKAFGPICQEFEAKKTERKGLKPFTLESTGEKVLLKLVKRNHPRTELRLYFNKGASDFKAKANQVVWARFHENEVKIGIRASKVKDARKLETTVERSRQLHDPDDRLNLALNASVQIYRNQAARRVPVRQVRLAKACFRRAKYCCEAGYTKPSFASRATGETYVEAHHLVPVSLQRHFKTPLDLAENIYALSPHAHRAIHSGKPDVVAKIIEQLLACRDEVLTKTGITRELLYSIYRCQNGPVR